MHPAMNQRQSQPAIHGMTHRVTIYRNWKERDQSSPSSHLLFHLACWPLPHSDPDSLGGPVNSYYDIETRGRWPSHIMVSVEKFKEIRSAFFFPSIFFCRQLWQNRTSSHAVRTRRGKKRVNKWKEWPSVNNMMIEGEKRNGKLEERSVEWPDYK